jgi:hypothetical protein
MTHAPDGTPVDPVDVVFADLAPIAGAVTLPEAA